MGGKPIVKDGRTDPAAAISTGKKVVFSLAFGLFCLLFPAMIEIGLRLAGFGIDTRAFISPSCMTDVYVSNINLFKKYYPRRALTRPDPIREMMAINLFSREKSAGVLRGFVVGGSTAQGFPYHPHQSFGKMTELALADGGRYEKVEVLNLGLSAVSSYFVRDMAAKLLQYEPDFLVIYAGHNEYYGTISATTGGSFQTRNLYLKLNELRLFQFLFHLRNLLDPSEEYPTLMEEQLSQQRLPLKPEMDQAVAEDFIKNIDAVVELYRRRHIPVIIMEPVCNLCDMPPFSGAQDDAFGDFIQCYAAVIKGNDVREIETFYRSRQADRQYDGNANVRYLDAVAESVLSGERDLDGFKAARDLDAVPFRAKGVLLQRLGQYCRDRATAAPNLHFIPLEKIMAEMYGTAAFDNTFFIDHLHFSQKGQQLVSRILAQRIAEIFHFEAGEKEKVASFYRDGDRIEQAVYYLPGCRAEVYRKMRSLTENSPYNKMRIAYQRKDVDGLTAAEVDPRLMDLILSAQAQKMDPAVVMAAFYVNQGLVEEGKKYLDLFLWNYPGNYRPYLIQARFDAKFSRDVNQTFAAYKTAYLLSDKLKTVYDETIAFLKVKGRPDLMGEIEGYGRPME